MLKKYIIERNVPGVGQSSPEELQQVTAKSNSVLSKMGPHIQWRESYITDDKIYCVYMAENAELVKEHARMGGFPADKITEVVSVLDPTSEGREETRSQKAKTSFEQSHLS